MRFLASLVAALLVASVARAETDVTLTHVGRLLDGADHPMSGTQTLAFGLFTSPVRLPSGESALWSESYDVNLDANGVYTVELGETANGKKALPVTALPPGQDVYLEVTVGTEVLSPRLHVGVAPLAISALSLGGHAAAEYLLQTDAATTYETKADAAATFETKADADLAHATFETKDEAAGAAAGGDASGTLANLTIAKLQGQPLAGSAPDANDVLKWNGSAWAPAADEVNPGTVTNVTAAGPLAVATGTTTPALTIAKADGSTDGYLSAADWSAFHAKLDASATVAGDLTGSVTGPTVAKLRGEAVSSTAPRAGEVLAFDGSAWTPTAPDQVVTGSSCAELLLAGVTTSGVYTLTPASGAPYRAYCDMTTNGGGWTLVLQASSASAFTYSHAVWTSASVPAGIEQNTDAHLDEDAVSPAFYTLPATSSMLCMGDLTHCAAWNHATNTAHNLAVAPQSGPCAVTASQTAPGQTPGQPALCTTAFCGANTLPFALDAATTGSGSPTWHRFGYVNCATNSAYVSTRVGYNGDGDSSDSQDTAIGIGLACGANCAASSSSNGPHNRGSGYYLFTIWAGTNYSGISAHPWGNTLSGALRGFLFVR